jgi:hypothetical protein
MQMQPRSVSVEFFPNVVLWGESYVRSFLETTVPTLLAPGNLEVLKPLKGSEFLIVCPEKERGYIEGSPEFQRITSFIPVRFLPFDWDMESKSQPILNLSEGHKRICQVIAKRAGFAVFLSPDCMLSANAFQHLVQAAQQGVRAVCAPGFRLIKEQVQAEFEKLRKNGVVRLTGRDLYRLFVLHHHAEMEGYFIDSQHFTRYPHYCFWPLNDRKAMVVRAFHLHPIMVQIPANAKLDTLDQDTIDGDFVGHIVGDFTKISVVRDVDDLVIFSLSPRTALPPEHVEHRYITSHVATWAFCGQNKSIHRYYFTQPILMHMDDVDQIEVAQLIEKSGRDSHDVLNNPRPIRYVGFSHEIVPNETLNTIATRELLNELQRRAKYAKWHQLIKGVRHLMHRV